ncbi:hypothetical protein C0992_011338, partial [Termitomyces sp. T32_za158]
MSHYINSISLDPERLQTSDFINFSDVTKQGIVARLEDERRISGKIFYTRDRQRFPSNVQGFLYYHCHPHLPPTTGEIRLRVTESSDPSYFRNGTDLMTADGALPWSIPVLRLCSMHAPLKELLGQDHNIPAALLSSKGKLPKIFLTYLEKPFVVTLEEVSYINTVDSQFRTQAALVRILLPIPRDHRQSVYKGKLLVRFERASLAEQEHTNDISIVMRVLKVLEPIEPLVKDAALLQPAPEAGTLLKALIHRQVRTLTFMAPILGLLPSIESSSPTPSNLTSAKRTIVDVLTRSFGTLNSRRLNASDFMDVSNLRLLHLYKRDDPQTPSTIYYGSENGAPIAFPTNAQGFLYLHHKPGLSPLSAQIRFRITPSDDPTQFEKGTDLVARDGQPWNIDALQLTNNNFAPLRDQLYQDGYVEIVKALSTLPKDIRHAKRIISYLEQPFLLDMSHRNSFFAFTLPNKVVFRRFFYISYDPAKKIHPYTGRLVVRFERSTLPEHSEGNFIVLRVLKILDPVKSIDPDYDGRLPVPIVGQVLMKTRVRARSYNLDKETSISGLVDLPSFPDDQANL